VTETTPGASSYTLDECPHCHELVPPGAFCGNCGAHFSDAGGRSRLHHFAAAPHEHVVKMSVISTLFPHLPRRHAHIFREVFVAGVIAVVLLGSLRLYTPALLAGVILLPVLYLLYLYEVEVYESLPLQVLLATFGVGAALGVGYVLGFGHVVHFVYNGTNQGPVFTGLLLPVVAQALMLVGPLCLLPLIRFDESLDGLSFGISSALGFTLASVLTGYSSILVAPLQGDGSISSDDIANVLRAAILAAVVNAATTGTMAAAFWLRRHGRSRGRHKHPLLGVPATAAGAFGAQVGLGFASYFVGSLLLVVVLWAISAAVLLVWLRIVLHNALLEEGAEHNIGELSACSECHRLVPAMYFCPACGVARSAAPKHARPGAPGRSGPEPSGQPVTAAPPGSAGPVVAGGVG
jgi:RNA polymerase subunit RPABC4/transcription elongation factor Spt4